RAGARYRRIGPDRIDVGVELPPFRRARFRWRNVRVGNRPTWRIRCPRIARIQAWRILLGGGIRHGRLPWIRSIDLEMRMVQGGGRESRSQVLPRPRIRRIERPYGPLA